MFTTDSSFLKGAYLLRRSVKETRLQTWIIRTECIEICKLVNIAVSLIRSTVLSTTISSSVLKLLVL